VSGTVKGGTGSYPFSSLSSKRGNPPCGDQGLLAELLRLHKQPFEPFHKRKLEAVALLLQHADAHRIEQCAHASLRTVQRWANQARRFGTDSLANHTRRSTASNLSDEQHQRLAADVGRPPSNFGYALPSWTAALLNRHIQKNYSTSFSLRHCRRLLTTFGLVKHARPITPSPKRKLVQTTIVAQESAAPLFVGEYARKRRALAAVKRLAGSGMPLQPFAFTLFDIINDAVPHDELSPGITAAYGESSRWIIRNFDYSRWFPQMRKYLLVGSPEISGFRPPSLLPYNPRTVLRQEEIVLPNYYRSEGYNEFFRSMGMHHGLLTLLRDEQGVFVGYYPIFRSEKMKPFSRDDVGFFEAAACAIAQGIRSAGLITYQSADDDGFEPFEQVARGMVVMDRTGKVLSINKAAQSLFYQFAIYDGNTTGFVANDRLSETLTHIARQLRMIFGQRDETCIEAQQPIVRIFSHRSGASIRLQGFASDLSEHDGHFTVLIEMGENENVLRQRISARHQLSHRQTELVMLLRHGASSRQIVKQLGISSSALKSSLRELRFKLEINGQPSLREFARVISPYSMSSPR
jgi:transposase/DNA-binding CsgD family transcriptional regulator